MEVTKKTSEIKKGDNILINAFWIECDSDAYKHNGFWTVDIYDGRSKYQFSPEDRPITVLEK